MSARLAISLASLLLLSPSCSAGELAALVARTRAAGAPATSAPDTTRLRPPARLPARTLRVPVLMYHRIGIAPPGASQTTRGLTVAPADFAAQMRWLKRHGYHAITQHRLYAALIDGAPLPSRPIVISFDDGYRDVLEHAAPVLRRLDLPAIVYVITERAVPTRSSFLTWPMMRRLERDGFEIGSHTVSHAELTSLPDRDALAELVDSRRALERRLGHPVQWLAYPYGAVDARVAALARRAGYVLAVTTRPGVQQEAARPLELRRLRVLDSTGVAGLAQILAAPTGAR